MEEQREVPSSWCAVPLGRKQVGVLDGSDARRRRNVADIDACDNMPGIEYADCTPQKLFLSLSTRRKLRWREAGREESEERSERKYTNEAPTSFLALPDRDANKANHRARVIPN